MNKTFRCLFACHGGDRIVEAICISESWERRELLFLMQIPFPLWTCQRLYNEDAYHRCQQPFWSSRLLSLVWFWFELWWLKKKKITVLTIVVCTVPQCSVDSHGCAKRDVQNSSMILSKLNSVPLKKRFPISPCSRPLATTILLRLFESGYPSYLV